MKTIPCMLITSVILLLNTFNLGAQQAASLKTKARVQTIEAHPLDITYFKTTNIVFPQAIVSVDRGSKDILAQKAKGVENILQVKAARDSFLETNLTVLTADGHLNSFILNYTPEPAVLNLSLSNHVLQEDTMVFTAENGNQASIQSWARAVLVSNKKIHGAKDKDFGIRLQMNALFIQDDILYCRVTIKNKTNINYDIDQLRFFIRDQKKAKRTATQEMEVTPAYIHNNTDQVKGQTEQSIVFALPKFTIPDKKYLAIQLMEHHGGRHLELHVKNKTIVKASVLPAP